MRLCRSPGVSNKLKCEYMAINQPGRRGEDDSYSKWEHLIWPSENIIRPKAKSASLSARKGMLKLILHLDATSEAKADLGNGNCTRPYRTRGGLRHARVVWRADQVGSLHATVDTYI